MRNPRLTRQDLAEAAEWAQQMGGLYGADGWLARRWTLPDLFPRETPPRAAQALQSPGDEPA